ncbi:MAG: hypothetical protein KF721_05435 [Ignavibacteriaceae bacterium]|nr:hypothetical protein [Ignavibacteriaceae bacterium]
MKEKIKKNLRYLFVPAGLVVGYLYYYYIGCVSGGCPLQSNPYFSTLYGGLIGLVLSLPSKKKVVKSDGPTEANN